MIDFKTNGQKLNGFPVIVVSLNDYAALPVFDNVHRNDIAKMPIGYQFRFPGTRPDGIKIVAVVVNFDDVLCEQWGAGVLGCPDRWVNRYAAIFENGEPA